MPISTLPLPLPAAPLPPSPPSPPSPALERLIGEFVALAACLFAQGLGASVRAGRPVPTSSEVKRQGAAVMAALIELREHTAGSLDFDRVARVRGAQALQDWWGSDVSAAMINELVAAVLDILGDIIRLRLN